ncbi:MAG TPA: sodium-translocating pyrophosphatase [Bdellovibrionales bacterium]|nr:sodium-translocating pyrophosphatase [Bdellovibrionales bacterium]
MRLVQLFMLAATMFGAAVANASEANLALPSFDLTLRVFGNEMNGADLLKVGMAIAFLGILFGGFEFMRILRLKAHKSMLAISELIYDTCKAYMIQQGKLILRLFVIVGAAIVYYFGYLRDFETMKVLTILMWTMIGILGSYSIAFFGMRINNYANSRAAFSSLRGNAYEVMEIPLRAGMSIGVILIGVELVLMITILLFVDAANAGACFIGFAIGESLAASALRIAGGIFTKIADIGADLMKIVFNIKEDDARNPGVIADCAGDNAGDSVGPTADGFETFGVTLTALISFIVLTVGMVPAPNGGYAAAPEAPAAHATLIVWIFSLSAMMIICSVFAYLVNGWMSRARFGKLARFNYEMPLTTLIWMTSLVTIAATYGISYGLLSHVGGELWWRLASIVALGTLGAALIPELTRVFTSTNSRHVREIVDAAREGGASLAVLSGLVAGNFSAFWKGGAIAALMTGAVIVANQADVMAMMPMTTATFPVHSIFAFGLLAFGFLSMGPVTIAVDSYGPVTDNAQSVFELSEVETKPGIAAEIQKEFGFTPNFEKGKEYLEENDGAGNTFKATSKPVLIATAVIGATTLIFSLVLMLNIQLSLMNPAVLMGIIMGGAVVYWFSGASMQAVTTGAFRAVEFIKQNIRLDGTQAASREDSQKVVTICTQYAQKGMFNIFIAVFAFTLSFAFFDVQFFTAYLISIATFGLFQALFMANAGGAWDNAKKLAETELRAKGTPLHAALVVGDTVGDPFKDTSSVALNPVIKFTTLFGLLTAEIAVQMKDIGVYLGFAFLLVALVFVYLSFYGMRITTGREATAPGKPAPAK